MFTFLPQSHGAHLIRGGITCKFSVTFSIIKGIKIIDLIDSESYEECFD